MLKVFTAKANKMFVVTAIVIAILFLAYSAVLAAGNNSLNFSDRIVDQDGKAIPNSSYNMKFMLYDEPSGGNQVWSEDQIGVATKGGRFSVSLGSANSLPQNIFDNYSSLYLHICIDVNGNAGDGSGVCGGRYEENFGTRKRLNASPWAMRALGLSPVTINSNATAYNFNVFGAEGKILVMNYGGAERFRFNTNGDFSATNGTNTFSFSPRNNRVTFSANSDIYFGTSSLRNTAEGTSGAGIIGVYNGSFTNIAGTTVQEVLESIDGNLTSGGSAYDDLNSDGRFDNDASTDIPLWGQTDGKYQIFRTVVVPSGTSPTADSYNDSLNLVAGTNVTITGDSTTDTITISASAAAATTFTALTDTPANYAGAGNYVVKVNAGATGLEFVAQSALDAGMFGGQLPAYYQSASNINAGTLGNGFFTAYGDLTAEGILDNDAASDILVRSQSDARYLSFVTITAPSGTSPAADTFSDTLTLVAGSNVTITGDSTTDTITIAATPGGPGAFTDLTDVPGSYAGSGDYIVKVNAGATGLEFVAQSSIDAGLLGGQNGAYYRNATNINAGTLGAGFFSAYGDLTAEGILDNDAAGDLLTRAQTDARYLGFSTISTTSGTAPVADLYNDSLTLTAGSGITITGDATTDTITISASGSTTFLGLTDTPANYTAAGDYVVKVNAGATGLEFVAQSTLNAGFLNGQAGSYYRDATNINAGTLGAGFFSAYSDLTAEGILDNDAVGDLLTRAQSDARYLGFSTISTSSGTAPVADLYNDSLTLTAGTGITITGNSGTDTITITATGPTTFLGLTDTPANYTAAGDYVVKVNAGATGLEFVAQSTLNAGFLNGQAGSYYRDATNINAGTLGAGFFSAYSDLTAEGILNNDAVGDLLTRAQSDARYLGFSTISTTSGTAPVADLYNDSLTLTAGTGITITGDSGTDTVTIASTVTGTLFTDSGTITYLTSTADDFAVGGSSLSGSFSVDVSANSFRFGTGATASAVLNFYASDGDTGSITYTTADTWQFTGGMATFDSNVGIGTPASSSYPLEVLGTAASVTPAARIKNSTLGGELLYLVNSSDANAFTFGTTNSASPYFGMWGASSSAIEFTADGSTNSFFDTGGSFVLGASSAATITAGDIVLNTTGAATFNEQGSAVNFRIEGDTDANLVFVQGSTDRLGIGVNTPNAFLDIKAATTGSAQLNLTTSAGTNPSTPVSGDLWWNGTNLNFYNGSGTTDLLAGAAGLFTDSGTITYLTSTTDDFAVGGTALASAFSIDVSTNTTRLGTGATAHAVLEMYASDGDTGTITFNSADTWAFAGGDVTMSGDLAVGSGAPAGIYPLYVNKAVTTDTESFRAGHFAATVSNTNTFNNYNLYLESTASPGIGNTINTLQGLGIQNTVNVGGTLSQARGIQVMTNPNAGTITTNYGIDVQDPSGAGTIGTNYGIFIANQTKGTTDYGLYIEDADTYGIYLSANTPTYLGGILQVGNTGVNTAFLNIAPATTSQSALRLVSSGGNNPSSPNSGDLWWNGTNLNFYNGSGTTDLLAAGSSLFTDGGTVTYRTTTTDDFAIGGTTLASPFSVDVSANTIRFGSGSGSNVDVNFYASDGDNGLIRYDNVYDRFQVYNGDMWINQRLDIGTTGTPQNHIKLYSFYQIPDNETLGVAGTFWAANGGDSISTIIGSQSLAGASINSTESVGLNNAVSANAQANQGDAAGGDLFENIGVDIDVSTGDGITTTHQYGIQIETGAFTGSTITNNYGMFVKNYNLASGATSNYGIYIDDHTEGTSDYGLYIEGSDTYALWVDNDTSRFDGIVEVRTLGAAGATDVCQNASLELSTCSSSLRYKENVADLELGLDTIMQLNPVTFNWKADGTADLGFIAEEVDGISPLLSFRNSTGDIEGVKYKQMAALFVNGIQEQQGMLADLETRVAQIENNNLSESGFDINNIGLINGNKLFEVVEDADNVSMKINIDRLVLPGSMKIEGNLEVIGNIVAQTIKAKQIDIANGISIGRGENKAIGTIAIPAGETSVTVNNASAETDSVIYLTTEEFTNVRYTNLTNGSFKVELQEAASTEIKVNYLIIN